MILRLIFISLIVSSVLCKSPTNSYAPGWVTCPNGALTRSSFDGLNPDEKSYIDRRYRLAKQSLAQFLKDANMTDLMLTRSWRPGAGELSALDSRSPNPSVLSGILQSSSYIAGLSGGAWMVGSIASNDLITVDQVLAQGSLWDLLNSLFAYNGLLLVLSNTLMWTGIDLLVKLKFLSGSTVSITDIYARALSYQLLSNYNKKGSAFCWSDVTSLPSFQNSELPYPILAAVGREPGTSIINFNSTVFELTPYEIGSWDPSLRSFMSSQYLGSTVDNGVASGRCIQGFDNAGFLMGTSSSLFNAILLEVNKLNFPEFIKSLINAIVIDPYERLNVDIAHYNPNPFYKSQNPDGKIANSRTLYLADGGEDGQNVPLLPLVHRNLSVIFAYDNSADTDTGWPDGTSLIKTYERQFSHQGQGVAFPYVPDQYTFRNLNLTSRPTFFGCDAKNLSSLTDNIYDVPLVIYTGNRPFSYWSNTSTFKLKYSDSEKQGMVANGYDVASRKDGQVDDEWAACVGCAIIRREQERQGIEQSEQCKRCFERYCWDGTVYQGPPLGDNFDDDGLIPGATYYNSNNLQGIYSGGIALV
ncbi:Lysophospholipase 2 [Candida viswanathii]|uniref:Lysophospholipase n=1 Tax=Candida viswanathii TaxID=5486 RepID=A0A367XXD8_9ASCO|nr:Lysophospholipase 2 [Candida viswanathii]